MNLPDSLTFEIAERTLTDADKLVFFDEPTATTDVASDVDPATSAEEDPEEDEGSDDDNDDDDGDDGNDGVNEDDDGDDENDDGDDEDDGDGPEIPVGETPAAEEPETSADSDGPEIPSGETPSDEDPAEVEETNGESIDDGPEIPNGETPDTTVDGATPGTTVDSDVPDDNGNGHDGEEKPYPPESPPVPAVDDDKTEDVEEDMVTDETDADDTNTTSDAPAPVPAGAEPDMDVTDTVGSVSNETASDTHAPIVTDSEEVTCTHFLQCQSASSARAALPMCDYRATDASQMQYNVGRWVEAKVPYADNALVGDALDTFAYNYQPACNRGPFRCHVTEPHSCGKRSLQMLRYHWQPDTCTVAPFIPDELEHRWAGKRVLFIGDSLMRQMFNSLRYLMREHWKTPEDGVRREPEYFETKSGARVEFAWSKFLLEERLLPDRMELPENNWPDLITKA